VAVAALQFVVLSGGLSVQAEHQRSVLKARCKAYLNAYPSAGLSPEHDDERNPYLRSLAPAASWGGTNSSGEVGDRVGRMAVPQADLWRAMHSLPQPLADIAWLSRNASRARGWPRRWDLRLANAYGERWRVVRDAPGRPFSIDRALLAILDDCAEAMVDFLGDAWLTA
jgi:hypothetical protein